MRKSKLVQATVLAAALLVLPIGGAGPLPPIGPEPAYAGSCRWKVEVCSEVDLYVWKGTVCITYCGGG